VWRAGSILDLGVRCRYASIIENKHILQKYAIAYCDGTEVVCRTKSDRVAVMFKKGETVFWNHLTTREFKEIFVDSAPPFVV
jgi:hypothetical protein